VESGEKKGCNPQRAGLSTMKCPLFPAPKYPTFANDIQRQDDDTGLQGGACCLNDRGRRQEKAD